MKKFLIITFTLSCLSSFSQTSTNLSITAYIEPYFGYDLSKPKNNTRPSFLYSYNRHNEVNLNIGFIKVALQEKAVRGNLALMAGTYTNANLASESGVLKNIYEANVGLKLSKKHETWLDAGVFGSHIGFESAVGKDCWTLTRSILAENSPYYEAGLKVTHTSDNKKWLLSSLVLNGWQQINRLDGNSKLAWGSQIQYKPNTQITLNSSTFFGTRPDDSSKKRIFHNFYGILQPNSKTGFIVGFDYGIEEKQAWYSPILIVRQALNEKLSISARIENYMDKQGVIIAKNFNVNGFSTNFDYSITEKIIWRIEGRILQSKNPIFMNTLERPTKTNTSIISSLALQF